MKKINIKALAIAIAIPLAVGAISALLTRSGMKHFGELEQPPLSPPAILFPIVWTILFTLMGIASYRIFEGGAPTEEKREALIPYFVQLAFNFLWTVLFFGLDLYGISFAWLLALIALIILTAVRFFKLDKPAGIMLFPYIAWTCFAAYLNLGIAYLNR